MFKSKNTRLVVDNLYINQHTLDQFKDRKTKKIDFNLPKEFVVNLLVQGSKNNGAVQMRKLRGAILLKNDLVLIVNIYEKNQFFHMKALTVLTMKQLKSSRNFMQGTYLNRGFVVEKPKVIVEDHYFDNRAYAEYLNTIEWDDFDLLKL